MKIIRADAIPWEDDRIKESNLILDLTSDGDIKRLRVVAKSDYDVTFFLKVFIETVKEEFDIGNLKSLFNLNDEDISKLNEVVEYSKNNLINKRDEINKAITELFNLQEKLNPTLK